MDLKEWCCQGRRRPTPCSSALVFVAVEGWGTVCRWASAGHCYTGACTSILLPGSDRAGCRTAGTPDPPPVSCRSPHSPARFDLNNKEGVDLRDMRTNLIYYRYPCNSGQWDNYTCLYNRIPLNFMLGLPCCLKVYSLESYFGINVTIMDAMQVLTHPSILSYPIWLQGVGPILPVTGPEAEYTQDQHHT